MLNKKNVIIMLYILMLCDIYPQIKNGINSTIMRHDQTQISIGLEFSNENPITSNNAGTKYMDFILSGNESQPGSPVLPSKTIFVALPPESNISFNLSDIKRNNNPSVLPSINQMTKLQNDSVIIYEDVQLSNDYLQNDSFPEKEAELIGYTWIRDYYCAVIKINTHSFNWKKKEINEIISAKLDININGEVHYAENKVNDYGFDNVLSSVILNYDEAKKFRTKRKITISENSGSWIDFSKEYVKLSVTKDGLYRINYNDMISYGIDPGIINPKTIKIYNKGKQVQIYVRGENDNIFNPDDYVEFWAERNYNHEDYSKIVKYGEDYINHMDRYSDTTKLWLSWSGDYGERIPEIHSFNNVRDTLFQHVVKKHLEADKRLWYYDAATTRTNLPFWQENKVWTWYTIGASGSIAFNFTASDILPESNFTSRVRLISNASNIQQDAHKVGSSLNSTTVKESITYKNKETTNFTSIFSSADLKTGTNTFRLFGLPTQATVNQSLIDWVDLEYIRNNYAINDSLLITVPEGYINSEKTILVKDIAGSSDDLIIYKIFPVHKKISTYELSSGLKKNLMFTDTLQSGDKYIIINKSRVITPNLLQKKYFTNIRNNPDGADYIIISNRELSESVNNYNQFINDSYEVRTKLLFVNDIYDEFNYGYTNAESIKDFLIFARDNWKEPSPTYLLLIGDANYDYRNVVEPAPKIRKKNLVPSYGMPVSDVWYVTWDSSNVSIPQMFVGRIPAVSNNDVYNYLNKHKNHVDRSYDDWNKSYLFFSGGDPQNPSELAQIKDANQTILSYLVEPKPTGGIGNHYYKTINPPSNFGPYSSQEIQQNIDIGGIFISYLGHSGTQTWDNGITQVTDLKNKYNNRHPLISDFGCATGRFAEPDVDAFGELFISQSQDGQAISYLGNSGFGYLSTSLRFPYLFYKQIILNNELNVGKAHYLAKMEQYNLFGMTDVNRVFTYCNLLFGDPIISIAIPQKPNFVLDQKSIEYIDNNISERNDSVKLSIKLKNYGSVPSDTISLSVADIFNSDTLYQKNYEILSPDFISDISISIPIRMVGEHRLSLMIDAKNEIDEISEEDNTTSIVYYIYSSAYRSLASDKKYGTRTNNAILNPILKPTTNSGKILLDYSTDKDFSNPVSEYTNLDTFVTPLRFTNLMENKRYWWRLKMIGDSSSFSEIYSFMNGAGRNKWYFDYPQEESEIYKKDVIYNQESQSLMLQKKDNSLKIRSAGASAGNFASFEFNSEEKLPNTFFWGITASIIDTITLKPVSIKYFTYPNPPSSDSLIKYIERLPEGSIVAMAICDDGAQSVLGYGGGTKVRRAIESLGSLYIDSVRYRESWCMIGKKGSPKGSAIEVYKKLFQGQAVVEMKKAANAQEGYLSLPVIGHSNEWQTVIIDKTLPADTEIEIYPIAFSTDRVDTLSKLDFINDTASIVNINAKLYREIRLLAHFKANSALQSPELKSVGVNYVSVPELGTNYQVVSVSRDSVVQGDSLNLGFYVYNVGESPADSFNVKVELVKPDNSSRLLMDSLVARIDTMSRKHYSILYRTNYNDGTGNMKFRIIMDTESKITELYKDNNIYETSFYVKPDTTPTSVTSASLDVTFDGVSITEGDYVSSNPELKFVLSYPVWFPVHDTTAIQIYMDNKQIYYSQLDFFSDTINRKAIFTYLPELEDGEHHLRVFGKNIIGKIENSPGYQVFFQVQNELKLLNVYNYPNPFKNNTSFTFTLTQIPDDLRIKIYTVAGRLIKDINGTSFGIHSGFNTIPWDGRDEDGNFAANGVYLYKVIVRKGERTEDIIQKLAVLR